MPSAQVGLPVRFAIALAIAAFLGLGQTRADDDTAKLRERALALNNVTGNDALLGEIVALAKEPQSAKKLIKVAVKMAKEEQQPFNYNASLILAEVARELKDVDTGKTFFRICIDQAMELKSGSKLAQSYGGLIDTLYEAKKYDESEKVCQEVLELPLGKEDDTIRRLKSLVIRRQIIVLAKGGKYDEATKLVDDIIKSNPGNWLQMELKAMVQREAGKFGDAAKTYETILDLVEKDKELDDKERKEFISDYKYRLSGVYVDMEQVDKAAEQLRSLLSDDPDNPTYNNDLGYIMADHNMNLDESEKLIRKAIEEERKLQKKAQPDAKPEDIKDNAAYVDSLGWVLFKQKKYKEAKEYLLQAVKDKEGQHIEIFDHLGDAHLALGEKTEAVAAWKKGLEVPSETKREQQKKAEVEMKIKANQP
ncbi:MAG TPA: tetratricopeptide repeat protein [Gemmataceae bacterium]|nr:tetratricopeptide repeat protein [Gemmataceae bacterium]